MAERFTTIRDNMQIADMPRALKQKEFPSVTLWNRVEGRPRTDNFARALKAEVRDPLWMISKQWQMGEFLGDDAGSPAFAKIRLSNTQINKFRADENTPVPFEADVPLEAEVEWQQVPLRTRLRDKDGVMVERVISLDIRLVMGRQWHKMMANALKKAGASSSEIEVINDEYIKKYQIRRPDNNDKNDAYICAHTEVWQQLAAVSGRCMDGGALYLYLKGDPARHAYDGMGAVISNEKYNDIEDIALRFISWFEKVYHQPGKAGENAWRSSVLEYRFSCSAPEQGGDEKVLIADEYFHGHLDWYNFDINKEVRKLPDVEGAVPPATMSEENFSFIPAPLVFDGMPNTRWWSFEDGKTNFGDIAPDTTDLAKLLLIEFGLIYANDWFLFPVTLPTGTLSSVQGLVVTNVFGEKTWVEPSGSGSDDDWQKWSVFTLNSKGTPDEQSDLSMLLLPTVPKTQEGKPVEEVVFIRDEMANMVWGIEAVIPCPSGGGKPGGEAAIEYLNARKRINNKNLPDKVISTGDNINIRYQTMSKVPENWIPFVPVHKAGNNRKIQLQRASLPRLLKGSVNTLEKVRPRNPLLQEGLFAKPVEAYYIFEEEIPRAGIHLSRSFQRTRWANGRVFVWYGAKKTTGRGEGYSGLAFDQIETDKVLEDK